jgi:hypothetical protein
MPVYNVQLDANGRGVWNAQQTLRQLTIINQGTAAVTVLRNNLLPGFTLNTNIQVQFEEEEAHDTTSLGFTGGPANGTGILISWE